MNTDRLQTLLGAIEAAVIAGLGALINVGESGAVDWQAPTFWIAIGLAALRAFKSYYAAGIKLGTNTPQP
ncbi:MAG: hypothetical protein OEW25_09990 [Nitrospira sp.]|nr:hypothetical protein [Nitrospira sp.]MDH5253643.1 hypothetical protein [Nitrospira sp.]